MCYCTEISICGGVSGGEGAVGLGSGQAGGLSATCPHGRDRVGYLVSEEDSAGVLDGGAIHMLVHGSHGFRDGGGLTQALTDSPVMDTPSHLQRTILATGEKTCGGPEVGDVGGGT
jgi:hypothetical protein